MSDKPKPCPFCGGPARVVTTSIPEVDLSHSYVVRCSALYEGRDCPSDQNGTKEQAIAAWNTRAPSPTPTACPDVAVGSQSTKCPEGYGLKGPFEKLEDRQIAAINSALSGILPELYFCFAWAGEKHGFGYWSDRAAGKPKLSDTDKQFLRYLLEGGE